MSNDAIIECVPNFSEGRDIEKVNAIAEAIASVDGIKLLHIDRGDAANRTVYTYVGSPEKMVESTFRAIKKATEIIDMRHHSGEHPRIGAADVVPFVPIKGISLEETAVYAEILSKRVSNELGIPVYAYEYSAKKKEREKLEYCRKGEYEGLQKKISTFEGMPDYGPNVYNDSVARTGASVIGARNFLLAVNFNLNTVSESLASMIAADVRDSGRLIDTGLWEKDENSLWVKKIDGRPTNIVERMRGPLKGCKAIGWYIKEYGIAQVSMNITNMNVVTLAEAFETVSRFARLRGVRVTGTEIIGLVPLQAMTDTGKYYLSLQGYNKTTENEQVRTAIRSLSLNDLSVEFDPMQKIIEYKIKK